MDEVNILPGAVLLKNNNPFPSIGNPFGRGNLDAK